MRACCGIFLDCALMQAGPLPIKTLLLAGCTVHGLWELVEACLPLPHCAALNAVLKDYLWDCLIDHNPDIILCRSV